MNTLKDKSPCGLHDHESELPLIEQLFPREYLPVAAGTLMVVSILFVFFGTLPTFLFRWTDSPKPNEIGDTFGFVNALFSGLGFAGLFITILIQIREFGMAQRERNQMIDQHSENVRIQEKISKQQHQSSLIQSVATFAALNPHRELDRWQFSEDDLEYLFRRAQNSLILEYAQDSMIYPNRPDKWGEGVYQIRKNLPDQFNILENCFEVAVSVLYMIWDDPIQVVDVLDKIDRSLEYTKPLTESNGRDASESDIQMARHSVAYLTQLRSTIEQLDKAAYQNDEKKEDRIRTEFREFKLKYINFIGPYFEYTAWKPLVY